MGFDGTFAHRDQLLAAALEEFADQGFAAASLNRILSEASMSKGQFYHHFDGKQGLYLAVVGHLIDRKQAHFAAHPVPPGDDFFATLRAQLEAGLAFAREHPDLERFSRGFLAERGQPVFDVVMQRYGFDERSGLARLVEAWRERGAFRSDLPPDFVRRAILVVFNQLPRLLDLDTSDDLDAQLDPLIRFLRRGLGRRS